MEYLRGRVCGELLRKRLRGADGGIITQVCEGLRLAHEGGTLWRDGATGSGY